MTNEQFWKKLDRITGREQTPETTIEFVETIYEGMKQDLALLICAVMKNADDDYAHQAYLESEFGRIMMCYTDD